MPMEVRPLESCVITAGFKWDIMLGVFNRQVRFSSCIVSAYSGMIQGKLYPLIDSLSLA